MQTKSPLLATLSVLISGGFVACASVPREPQLTPSEQVRIDNAVGRGFVEKLDFTSVRVNDAELSRYLSEVVQNLVAGTPELRESPVHLALVENRNGVWRNYSLPGIKIYLSLQFLKSVEFESELAAVLAMEIAHILKRDLLRNVLAPDGGAGTPQQVVVRPEHFNFTAEDWGNAAELAVRLLYDAQFDPRGLLSLFRRYQADPAHSPIPEPLIATVVEHAYAAVVTHPPLRNPVVRSERFLAMQKRMRKL